MDMIRGNMANRSVAGLEEMKVFSLEMVQRAGQEALNYYGKGRSQAVFDQAARRRK